MPGYRTHLLTSLTLATVSAPLTSKYLRLDPLNFLLFILLAGIGSLAPDLDHPKSKAHRFIMKLALIVVPISAVLILEGICPVDNVLVPCFILALISIPNLFKHRGLWHFPLGLLLAVPLYFFLETGGLAASAGYTLGYISHLFLDHLEA